MDTRGLIKSKLEEIENKRQQLLVELRDVFPELFKDIFDKYSWLRNFSWTQYTPYFNDGDECTFSVNSYSLMVNGIDTDWYESSDLVEIPESEFEEASTELQNRIESIPDDYYKDLFGDHVQVTVDRSNSITVERCDHD